MAIIAGLIVLLFGIRYSGKNGFFDNNFSVSETRALKGLCAIFVVFHHLCTYMADFYPSFYAFKYIGFLMVGGFFMISGYGLTYGIINKLDYLKGFFKKRMVSVIIPFYIINIFYIFANHYTKTLTYKYIISSVFGLNMWYVFTIMVMYTGFYFCFKFFDIKKGTIIITAYTFLYIAVMLVLFRIFKFDMFGYWWYNSVICFPLGILYCVYKSYADNFFKKHYHYLLAAAFAVTACLYIFICNNFNENILTVLFAEIICSAAFALFTVLLSFKLQIGNKVLNICGDLSLELYLSHALFIFAFKSDMSFWGISFYIQNNFLYLIMILVSTFAFSWIVHKISGKIIAFIKNI
ncbi:MAG: acyltransferase [Clostridia bacterium]|nr:acyltransferase [Clostridia bacterium]